MAVTQEKPLNGGASQAARWRPAQPDPQRQPAQAGPGVGRRLLKVGLGLVLALLLLLGDWAPPGTAAHAWTLPGRGGASAGASRARPTTVASRSAGTPLQEVAAPIAVQQLAEALAQRQPRLTIVEPADGAFLPEGPWTLQLQVEDWPLVDAGPLGLGPHLLVQLDDGPVMPVVQTSVAMPPLSLGSHRLTVMAARPWGEVVKRPGAFQQIRLQRVAANPLSQPAPGSPQLLVTAPIAASTAEPVLLDWLLIDAPLQNLRADDARWRLRVSVNGDSFLVDQATPLWLKGWRRGSNALLLELVDGRGDPLNPPFNSLVREVLLLGEGNRPAWLNGRLSDPDLARLLGETPPELSDTTLATQPQGAEAPGTSMREGAPMEPSAAPTTGDASAMAARPGPRQSIDGGTAEGIQAGGATSVGLVAPSRENQLQPADQEEPTPISNGRKADLTPEAAQDPQQIPEPSSDEPGSRLGEEPKPARSLASEAAPEDARSEAPPLISGDPSQLQVEAADGAMPDPINPKQAQAAPQDDQPPPSDQDAMGMEPSSPGLEDREDRAAEANAAMTPEVDRFPPDGNPADRIVTSSSGQTSRTDDSPHTPPMPPTPSVPQPPTPARPPMVVTPSAGKEPSPPAPAGRVKPESPPEAQPPESPLGNAPRPRPSAREEVRPDGTLIRPSRSGPLQALRERLLR
jgi:hypothetical protein